MTAVWDNMYSIHNVWDEIEKVKMTFWLQADIHPTHDDVIARDVINKTFPFFGNWRISCLILTTFRFPKSIQHAMAVYTEDKTKFFFLIKMLFLSMKSFHLFNKR